MPVWWHARDLPRAGCPLAGRRRVRSCPIATALLRAHRLFGQQVLQIEKPDDPLPPGVRAVVVASHGNDEQPVLEAALRADVHYVGLVASRRRGPVVLNSLEVDERMRSRVRTPAGIDIGARTAPEVAFDSRRDCRRAARTFVVSRRQPRTGARQYRAGARSGVRHDGCPVEATPHVETPTGMIYFCGTGCRNAYLDNPLAYAQ